MARALITSTRIILADEPTGTLDPRSSDDLLRLFGEVNQQGHTILMVTHSARAASRSGRVLFIRDGEVFHQLYRGEASDALFCQKIADALTLLAAVLIICYNQVSEDCEDVRRFEIIRKVGMTKPEIKRSIASQLLMVFMLPLAFAFPMMFGLTNIGLFIRTTLISFAVFATFCWIVYRVTSGVYYRIVSRISIVRWNNLL